MQGIWQDLRYGLRGLAKRPGFTILAVLTLALGIGAATTIFSVIYNVMLDPFPYTDAHRVAQIMIRDATSTRPGGRTAFQVPEFLEYQEQNHVFDAVIGGGFEDVLMTTAEGTEQLNGGLTTPNLFAFLGVPAALGRTFTPDDAKPGAPPVFVMAYKAWARHFSLDPGVVGRTFTLNGVPMTLIGIMPPRFTKMNADVYRPVVLNRGDSALARRYFMFQAKLKPGVTLEQAAADIDVIARRVAKDHPDLYPKQFTVTVDELGRQHRRAVQDDAVYARGGGRRCCWRYPASTSPTCCSRSPPDAKRRWRFAARLAPAEYISSANSSSRVCCSRPPARRSAVSSRSQARKASPR